MKKPALFLCAALLAGTLSCAAYADSSRSEEFPNTGITLNFTPEFEAAKGVIIPSGGFDIGGGAGIYETDLIYFAIDQEEYDRISENPAPSDEEIEKLQNSYAPLVTIISADNGKTFDDVNEFAGGTLDSSAATLICTVDDFTHYLYEIPGFTLPEGTDAVFAEEYETLKGGIDELIAGSEFSTPTDPMAAMIGQKIRFETTDTEGNPVNSEELFGSHEITMVNIWASWCGPCKNELEELEAINGRLAEKDCAVVGLLADGDEDSALASGKETLKEKGVTYLNILPPEDLENIFTIEAYPTTYFVNREGVIVGTPIVGADIDKYEPMVEALLTGDESAVEEISADSAEEAAEEGEEAPLIARVETNEDSLYRVIVLDEDGNPVPEVTVQFCSDTACMMGETDETGTAVFEKERGHYTVHILEAPEEYEANESEFTLEEYCDLTIYLFRA